MDFTPIPFSTAQTNVRLAPLPCGVVVFNSTHAKNGQCFLPDGQQVNIDGPSQLRNDLLWVSNVSALDPVTHLYPNLRSDAYFKRKGLEICQDIGLISPELASASERTTSASQLSTVFTRVMTCAARAYGWDVFEMGPLRATQPYLMRDIAAGLPDDPQIDDGFSRVLAQAYQSFSAPQAANYYWSADSFSVTLRFNELTYAKQLLHAPIPIKGTWHPVSVPQDWSASQALSYCLVRPCVVRASLDWSSTPEEISVLAAFGMSGQARGVQRRWLTQPELAWISKLARVTIQQFWVFDGELSSLDRSWMLPELLQDRPQASLSYSAGLVAYNHLLAVSQSDWDRLNKAPKCSVRAAWLRAYDRAMMFGVSLAAHKKGFTVERYGLGSIRVRVKPEQLDDLQAFKVEHGLMYPDLKWVGAHILGQRAGVPGAIKKRGAWGLEAVR